MTLASMFRFYFKTTQFMVNHALAAHRFREKASSVTGKVLDIGAGTKPYEACFVQADQYIGTNTRCAYSEEDQKMLEAVTDEWIEDGGTLPFSDASFDSVLSFQVLSVIQEPVQFFREAARVLKPGGVFLLTTDFLYPKWSSEDVMRHTDVNLRRIAEDSGYTVETLESLGGMHTTIHGMVSRYIREYPQFVKRSKNPLMGGVRGVVLLFLLLLSPVFSLLGWIIFHIEKDLRQDFTFSCALIMIARKK